MRSLVSIIVVLLAAGAASAAPSTQSNPAFLGIAMVDFAGGCEITGITRCSPAEDGGLRDSDLVVGMDGNALVDPHTAPQQRRSSCDVLREKIMAHAPGDVAAFELRRNGRPATVKVTLSTRADVQHRCFVGQAVPGLETKDIDNPDHEIDLGELRGKTTVLAWFRLDRCISCGSVIDKVADGIRDRIKDETPDVIGITAHNSDPLQSTLVSPGQVRVVGSARPFPTRSGFGSTLPLLVAEEDEFSQVTLQESDRVQFMVVDCRGIIRFVAPLAPGSEDLEAAVDEVLAAVEQAEHSRTQRR
ncbi:MAG TPA: PDZ domain-containing protein [Kofleriaceae bacterium]|nr:PDZ domain-containing protein [Kofleriaceae bacterium]